MVPVDAPKPTLAKTEEIRSRFRQLLDKTNKEHPRPKDVEALANLLNGNKALELWRDVLSASQFAERFVIENSPARYLSSYFRTRPCVG